MGARPIPGCIHSSGGDGSGRPVFRRGVPPRERRWQRDGVLRLPRPSYLPNQPDEPLDPVLGDCSPRSPALIVPVARACSGHQARDGLQAGPPLGGPATRRLQGARERPREGHATYAAAGIGRRTRRGCASAGICEGDRAAELALRSRSWQRDSPAPPASDAPFVATSRSGWIGSTTTRRWAHECEGTNACRCGETLNRRAAYERRGRATWIGAVSGCDHLGEAC